MTKAQKPNHVFTDKLMYVKLVHKGIWFGYLLVLNALQIVVGGVFGPYLFLGPVVFFGQVAI